MDNKQAADLGMIGLGVMGKNLLLNMRDHGFVVAGYDKDVNKVKELQSDVKNDPNFQVTNDLAFFIQTLKKPRTIMLLVPAGKIVDSVIQELIPYLEAEDLIIDAGNSYFKDTDRRLAQLENTGILYLGMGVSGGEEGARKGPSLMPGGSKKAFTRIQTLLKAIAAKVSNESCVAYLGEGSAGHYVKMVHNGIEYGIMQLIAESYDLMKRGLNFTNHELSEQYNEWNKGELNSYLIEITSRIFKKQEEKSKGQLIDLIADVAEQNGTGLWTAQSAMDLQVPVPTIDVAVSIRNLSVLTKDRSLINSVYASLPMLDLSFNPKNVIQDLGSALYVGMVMVYSQGMALLKAASNQYGYHLDLQSIARIWRGGCIIRAALLEDICVAFQNKSDLSNLLLDPLLSNKISRYQSSLRNIVALSAEKGIPIPALMSSLGYFDAYRNGWLPINLIQAQRDYFGSHGYERIGVQGKFHTQWE